LVRRARSLWSPALAAGLVLGLVGVLVAVLAVAGGIKQAGVNTPAPTVFGFEDGLGIWKFSSINRDVQGNDEYTGGVDTSVAHSGKASAYIATSDVFTATEPMASAEMNASISANPYRGERVRLSGYVKASGTLWAVMAMHVTGQEVEAGSRRDQRPLILGGDTMTDRPILGTGEESGWQRYETVLDVPPEAVSLGLNFRMEGMGRIWLDDVVIEVVGKDVATTDMYSRSEPSNLDFEDGLKSWGASSSQWRCKIGTVTGVVYSGRAAGYLDTRVHTPDYEGYADLTQMVSAERYRGGEVRFSVYIKTQDVENWVAPWITVLDNPYGNLGYNGLRDDPLKGTNDWRKYEFVVSVPEKAHRIVFGIEMQGKGAVWIDEVRLERVETATDVLEQIDLKNPGLEDGLAAWQTSSQPYKTNFSVDVDKTVAHSGSASALIKSNGEDVKGSGSLTWSVDAKEYQGKRLRWSGYLKSDTKTTETAEGRAGLWMSVSGVYPGQEAWQVSMMASDNMMDRPVVGSTDWQRYDVVMDVPAGAERITFGAALDGPGKMWVDDVRLEVVSADVPSTEYYRGTGTRFENTGFENGLAGWHKYSQRFSAYESGVDKDVKHGGEASGYLKAEQANLEHVPGELGQKIRADEYRGQRVRLTAYIKTKDVEGGVGIGMGSLLPDGSRGPYDDMTTRLITGTNDWQQVQVVVDVPEEATTILMGVVMYGPGQMWADDLQLDVVGKDVPLTSRQP
jgi:hypothetical protein